ncbi:hypothetical protein CXF72_13325 [Psychromonas sp. MB-3u-54]|uniref:ParE family toxin-like protein n=1 Tax=Psychromonas sp. MB-3u-54 TaxID=2058319 RepID=UPI000C327C33|nr:hypothetical protein [Psychromonas sp. MB-3u-54]PKH02092.1 hypothetical protein CXF72_13325 [Psychromonas sp. MB-3u-54]
MTSINQLIQPHNLHLPECYQQKAKSIELALSNGESFSALGGKRIHCCPNVIRFKLSKHWRLLCLQTNKHIEPFRIITRQKFETEIKRRHK